MVKHYGGVVVFLGMVLIAVLAVINIVGAYTQEERIIHVQSKERLYKLSKGTEGEFQNYVYADDDIYVVQDSFWILHCYSAKVFAKIKENTDCKVKINGFRIGFLSRLHNIIDAELNLFIDVYHTNRVIYGRAIRKDINELVGEWKDPEVKMEKSL